MTPEMNWPKFETPAFMEQLPEAEQERVCEFYSEAVRFLLYPISREGPKEASREAVLDILKANAEALRSSPEAYARAQADIARAVKTVEADPEVRTGETRLLAHEFATYENRLAELDLERHPPTAEDIRFFEEVEEKMRRGGDTVKFPEI